MRAVTQPKPPPHRWARARVLLSGVSPCFGFTLSRLKSLDVLRHHVYEINGRDLDVPAQLHDRVAAKDGGFTLAVPLSLGSVPGLIHVASDDVATSSSSIQSQNNARSETA